MRWFSIAVAVPGRPGATCEDAAHGTDDTIVVADGLGSTGRGAEASAIAADVVLTAVRDRVLAGAPLPELEETLSRVYRERAGDDPRLATTCLFAIAAPSRVVVGLVGDGLVAVLTGDGEVERLESGRGSFGNETEALPRWPASVRAYLPAAVDAIWLASDGVADDIVGGREAELVRGFFELARAEGRDHARGVLEGWLRDWATPGSHDDRSVAMLAKRAEPSEDNDE